MSRPQICVPTKIVNTLEDGTKNVFIRNEELGRGTFAVVFRVTHQSTNQVYAMKVISKEPYLKNKKTFERLKNEVDIQMMVDHPNVVRSKFSFSDESNYYLVLEYCPGKNVREYLRTFPNGRIKEPEARKILKDVIQGVSYLHSRQIVHYDLKLENYIIDSEGNVKIADFGLSTFRKVEEGKKYSICGTPNYLCPEVLRKELREDSFKVDVWAIGVSAYIMLYGRGPFEGRTRDVTFENIKKGELFFPSNVYISSDAKEFIKSTLQSDFRQRPTVNELINHPFISKVENESVKLYRPNNLPQLVKQAPSPQKATNNAPNGLPPIKISWQQNLNVQNSPKRPIPNSPKQLMNSPRQPLNSARQKPLITSPRQRPLNSSRQPLGPLARQHASPPRTPAIQSPRIAGIGTPRQPLASPPRVPPLNVPRAPSAKRPGISTPRAQASPRVQGQERVSIFGPPRQQAATQKPPATPSSPRNQGAEKVSIFAPPKQQQTTQQRLPATPSTPRNQNPERVSIFGPPKQQQAATQKPPAAPSSPRNQNPEKVSIFVPPKPQPAPQRLPATPSTPRSQNPERAAILSSPRPPAPIPSRVPPPPGSPRNPNPARQPKKAAPPAAAPPKPPSPAVGNLSSPDLRGGSDGTFVIPSCFISRHCFYSGDLGYLLGDGTVGVCFKDQSRIVMDPNEKFVQFYAYQHSRAEVTILDDKLESRVGRGKGLERIELVRKVARNFKKIRFSYELPENEYVPSETLYNVKCFVKNEDSILFRMNDTNLQVNFNDHMKLIIFWDTKKMCFFRNIRDRCSLMDLSSVANLSANSEELKKFRDAKVLMSDMALSIC